jgi:hypothetical protein
LFGNFRYAWITRRLIRLRSGSLRIPAVCAWGPGLEPVTARPVARLRPEARAAGQRAAAASEDVGLVPLRRAWAQAPQPVSEEPGA